MADTDTSQDAGQVIDPAVETQAREMGWMPQEDFKGDPEKWVDAQTFLDRGEHVLPIVRATNRRLREDLGKTHTEVARLADALRNSQETIKALEDYHLEDVKQKVEGARKRLLDELKAAKRDQDTDREVELTDELTRLNTAEAGVGDTSGKTDAAKPADNTQRDYTKEPDFVAWQEENSWFGESPLKTAVAQMVAAQLRRKGDMSVGRTFLDKVTAATEKELGSMGARPTGSKVEASRGGGTGGKGNSKTYNDMPADAKAACDGFANKVVGDNRAYKTLDDWRKKYATDYFTEV